MEARRIIGSSGHHTGDADGDGKDGKAYFMRVSRQRVRYLVRRNGSFCDPLEQVTWLAVEHPAHGLQGAETNSLGATVLEHRYVRQREPDALGNSPTLILRLASSTSMRTTMGIR